MIQRNLYDEISQAIHGVISYAKCGMSFLSSANEVWVGNRNAGRPSVCLCLSFRLSALPSVQLVNAIS